ncbi:Putative colanic biosynthesis UDP-glucose lipid carrier transferase, partial [Dysosmobacter welbionis]
GDGTPPLAGGPGHSGHCRHCRVHTGPHCHQHRHLRRISGMRHPRRLLRHAGRGAALLPGDLRRLLCAAAVLGPGGGPIRLQRHPGRRIGPAFEGTAVHVPAEPQGRCFLCRHGGCLCADGLLRRGCGAGDPGQRDGGAALRPHGEKEGCVMLYLELFLTFFKIGLFTIGGGYAMLPLIQADVQAKGWMTAEELVNFIAVSESTPGPFAVNVSTY